MTPAEIIKKQAEAVTGFNKLTAAEHLEAAAKLLRGESGQEKKESFAAFIRERKNKGINKAIAGFRGLRNQQIEQAFAGSDWVKVKENNGVKTYCRKGMAHLYINVKGSEFCVTEGEKTGAFTSVSSLGAFVEAEKKNRK
jgi:hypothetical protein